MSKFKVAMQQTVDSQLLFTPVISSNINYLFMSFFFLCSFISYQNSYIPGRNEHLCSSKPNHFGGRNHEFQHRVT